MHPTKVVQSLHTLYNDGIVDKTGRNRKFALVEIRGDWKYQKDRVRGYRVNLSRTIFNILYGTGYPCEGSFEPEELLPMQLYLS